MSLARRARRCDDWCMDDRFYLGWLVILRHQFDHGFGFKVPTHIGQELVERGWIETRPGENNLRYVTITGEGDKVCDLHAAEWGIDPIERALAIN